MRTKQEELAVEIATERCANGWTWPKNDLEIDAETATSAGEHGVWVRAWVLVDAEDLEPETCTQHRDTGRGVCADCGVAL
jgi:hypothetical protein